MAIVFIVLVCYFSITIPQIHSFSTLPPLQVSSFAKNQQRTISNKLYSLNHERLKSQIFTFRHQSLNQSNQDDNESSSTIEESCVIQKLDLQSKFKRWKMLQDILEEEEPPSAQDINEILYLILKSFLDNPRPRKLPNGDRNPSPLLNDEQCDILVNQLFEIRSRSTNVDEDDGDGAGSTGWIYAIPTDVDGSDSMEYDDAKIIKVNDLLEKFQPDREEDEDAFKSCWDLVMELYGREATRMAEQSGDKSWKVRSGVVRLLIHFDFLGDGLIGEDP
jgi:hypothetical protein